MIGCSKSIENSSIKQPIDIQTGKAGNPPTEVFQNYNWVCMSQERFLNR